MSGVWRVGYRVRRWKIECLDSQGRVRQTSSGYVNYHQNTIRRREHTSKSELACQRKVYLRSRAPMSAVERAPVSVM